MQIGENHLVHTIRLTPGRDPHYYSLRILRGTLLLYTGPRIGGYFGLLHQSYLRQNCALCGHLKSLVESNVLNDNLRYILVLSQFPFVRLFTYLLPARQGGLFEHET